MFVTQYQDSNTLLTYSLSTDPLPVQVSPASGPPATATITLVVSLPKGVPSVTVTQIAVTLPIMGEEPDAADLAMTDKGIGHTVSSSGTDKWTNDTDTMRGTFVIKPAVGQTGVIDAQGLTISFPNIQVSPIVGTTWIKVREKATADSSPAQLRSTFIAVAKFPAGFFAGNFAAVATRVQNGQSAELKWNGSPGAIYTLLWDGNTEDVSKFRGWKSPPLVRQTIFMLSVAAQRGEQTTILYFSVTVDVANPDLLAKTLDVHEAARIKGDTVLARNATIAGTAEILGIAKLKTDLAVTGLTSTGRLLSNGQAVVGGTLAVAGSSTFNSGSFMGTLSAGGDVAMIAGAKQVKVGNYPPAATDGFVIGVVWPKDRYEFQATICGSSGGVNVRATGGAWVYCANPPNPGNSYYAPSSGTFILPVRKTMKWSIWMEQPWKSLPLPNTAFYWVPLGLTQGAVKKERGGLNTAKSKTLPPPATNPSFSGHAKLVKGRATVRLAAIAGLREFIKLKRDYVVQLTPLGECTGLAVVKKLPGSFNIVELGGGRSSLAVDWTLHLC